MKIKISRHELCDLIMACTACEVFNGMPNGKFADLHDKLKIQLDEHDKRIKELEMLREVTK